MYQSQRLRGLLALPIPLIRAFLLCLLLLSSQLSGVVGFFPSVEAAGNAHGGAHPQLVRSLVRAHVRSSRSMQANRVSKFVNTHVAHINTVHPQSSGKNHASHVTGPDFTLTASSSGSLTVGNPITFTFTASNASNAGVLQDLSSPLTVTITLPNGFTNITSLGSGWTFTTNGTQVVATYHGTTPINPGDMLPAITVTGVPTASVQSLLASQQVVTGTISTASDINTANNTATIPLSFAAQTTSTAGVTTTVAAPTTSTTTSATGTSIDATISNTATKGSTYNIGGTVTYNLNVQLARDSAPIQTGTKIVVEDILPTGLSNVTASAPNGGWSFNNYAALSPSDIIATYTATNSLSAGATLPPISISGVIQPGNPQLTHTAILSIPGNSGTSSATSTINIVAQINSKATATVGTNPVVTTGITPTTTINPVTGVATALKITSSSTSYTVGLPVTYTLSATNNADLPANSTVVVTDYLQKGLSNISASSSTPALEGNWKFAISSLTSPAIVTGTFTSATTIPAGTPLKFTITGMTNTGIATTFTTNATLSVNSTDSGSAANTRTISYTTADSYCSACASVDNCGACANVGDCGACANVGDCGSCGVATNNIGTNNTANTNNNTGTNNTASTNSNTGTNNTASTNNNTGTNNTANTNNNTGTNSTASTNNTTSSTNENGTTNNGGVASAGSTGSTGGSFPGGSGIGPVGVVIPPVAVSLDQKTEHGDFYNVGNVVTFILLPYIGQNSSDIANPGVIELNDVVPVGAKDIHVAGRCWDVAPFDSEGPTLISARLTCPDSLTAGQELPVLRISLRLTNDAVPTFTNAAEVDVEGGNLSPDNISAYTVFVKPFVPSGHPCYGNGYCKGHNNGNGKGTGNPNGKSNGTGPSPLSSNSGPLPTLPLTGYDPDER